MIARDSRFHSTSYHTLMADAITASEKVGVQLDRESNYSVNSRSEVLSFRLVPRKSSEGKYQKLSGSMFNRGRKCNAVCWHGHREFFRALFEMRPHLRVRTMLVTYTGRNDFEMKWPETGDDNVGSGEVAPVARRDACACKEDE